MQIKGKVLHSPNFVSLMIFLVQTSVHTCSNHWQTSPQKTQVSYPSSYFNYLSFGGLVLQKPPLPLFERFLRRQPSWLRSSEAIFFPTEASKTFIDVTNRTQCIQFFCGFILLRLCRIWLQVTFQCFLISNIIQKSCKM